VKASAPVQSSEPAPAPLPCEDGFDHAEVIATPLSLFGLEFSLVPRLPGVFGISELEREGHPGGVRPPPNAAYSRAFEPGIPTGHPTAQPDPLWNQFTPRTRLVDAAVSLCVQLSLQPPRSSSQVRGTVEAAGFAADPPVVALVIRPAACMGDVDHDRIVGVRPIAPNL
jgi:hypothetical protein